MDGVVLGLLFSLGWVPLYLFRAEARSEALPAYSGVERLCVQLAPAVLATHVTTACVAINLRAHIPFWAGAVSVLIFAGGVGFWFWGRMLIGPLRARRLPDDPPPRLRRHGAFGIVRNPLYFGYLICAAAPLVVAPRPFLGITYACCVTVLAVRAAQEERRLHAQLGPAYAAYCREVKRLVPFVW